MCGSHDIFIGQLGVEAASLSLSFRSENGTWVVKEGGEGQMGGDGAGGTGEAAIIVRGMASMCLDTWIAGGIPRM